MIYEYLAIYKMSTDYCLFSLSSNIYMFTRSLTNLLI